ncbi:MAG: hypothetical protein JWN70_3596 [Planctomycetaceae bacterium]|nr:hypothetical protein [Planctomycetaceae bacterium]
MAFRWLLVLSILTGTVGCATKFEDFTPPSKSFSIKLAGEVKPVSLDGAEGEAWESSIGTWGFAVSSVELAPEFATMSPAEKAAAIDNVLEQIAIDIRGSRSSTTDFDLNGIQGKESQFIIPSRVNPETGKLDPASSAIARLIQVKTRIFTLFVHGAGSISPYTPEARTFFESFKLNTQAEAPTPPK